MTILDKIIEHKKQEVAARKKYFPTDLLAQRLAPGRVCLSLVNSLRSEGSTGIIAEFKRKSPSKGIINDTADITVVTSAYTCHGAAGLSVLTDETFFAGTWIDLVNARANNIPILRKDFIIDEHQVKETRLLGADVILLIAACLSVAQAKELAQLAKQEGLEVLLELHKEDELEYICDEVDMVGINSRNLKTFEVDREAALRLATLVGKEKPLIAESGINSLEDLKQLRLAGFEGFLIGEHFMKAGDPGAAFQQFVQSLKTQI